MLRLSCDAHLTVSRQGSEAEPLIFLPICDEIPAVIPLFTR
jgi:hypothetical protein